MKCHYEILGIKRDASDDEIKKSYRKLALQWHPDKNPDKVEECTEQFRLIQQAYDVLSDDHERAWYDKHREAILQGGLGHGDNYKDTSLDVYQYFNTSCYSGFGSNEKGFYAVFCDVFRKIDEEDSQYKDDANDVAPLFGGPESSYDEVVSSFYAYWESYCTAKSYVWAEKFDTREAPSRPVRRAMELENKKLRDKAKKERNEEVRELVQFVRKRDPRVKAYKKRLEERAVEIAKLANEQKQRHREAQRKKLSNYQEVEWSATSELEYNQLEAGLMTEFGGEPSTKDGDANESNDEEDYDELYCVACNKRFRSEKSFANHEKSKKHQENLILLQEEMEKDNEELVDVDQETDIDGENVIGSMNTPENGGDALRHVDVQEFNDSLENDDPLKNEEECDDNNEQKSRKKSSKKKQKQRRKLAKEMQQDQVTKDVEQELITSVSNLTVEQADDSQVAFSAAEKNEKSVADESVQEKKLPEQRCLICNEVFESRNKLFDHIKVTGHAILKNAPVKATTNKDSKPNQKQRRKKK